MYADDTVLFSESISLLQNMLNTLQNYTIKWVLDVNEQKWLFLEMVEKSIHVVMRNGESVD